MLHVVQWLGVAPPATFRSKNSRGVVVIVAQHT